MQQRPLSDCNTFMGWQTVPRLLTCCTAHHMHADVCTLGRWANLLEVCQEGARSAQSQVESCALIGLLQLPSRLLGCALLHCQAPLCVVKGPLQAELRIAAQGCSSCCFL
jgi:hypothetical protein